MEVQEDEKDEQKSKGRKQRDGRKYIKKFPVIISMVKFWVTNKSLIQYQLVSMQIDKKIFESNSRIYINNNEIYKSFLSRNLISDNVSPKEITPKNKKDIYKKEVLIMLTIIVKNSKQPTMESHSLSKLSLSPRKLKHIKNIRWKIEGNKDSKYKNKNCVCFMGEKI